MYGGYYMPPPTAPYVQSPYYGYPQAGAYGVPPNAGGYGGQNAGGVGVSGLEMAQNASRANWSRAEVDGKLKDMMAGIYAAAVANAPPKAGAVRDLEVGANRAGFLKVAAAMHDLGWI